MNCAQVGGEEGATKRPSAETGFGACCSKPTLDRMFSHPRKKVDLLEATNMGKIVRSQGLRAALATLPALRE